MEFLKKLWSWLWMPLIGVVVAVLIVKFVAKPTTVDGPSMQPNLESGEHVWAMKTAPIHRGSVIVFNADGVDPAANGDKLYVKRVIGIPGDKVTCQQNTIYVNDRPIKQDYISKKEQKATGNWTLTSLAKKNNWQRSTSPKVVPQDQYFVLGDHRSVSNDGRYFGFVPQSNVVGVVKSFWWDNATSPKRRNYVNKQWKDFWQVGGSQDE